MFIRNEEEVEILHSMLENIDNEYVLNKKNDNKFWTTIYKKLSLVKRKVMWLIKLERYEYMVHGEFDENSVEREVQLLIQVIKDKDDNSRELLSILHNELLQRPLQNEEISKYMANRLKELNL